MLCFRNMPFDFSLYTFLFFFFFCFALLLIMFIQLLWELNMQSVWCNHVPSLSGKGENANLNFIQFSKTPWCKMISSLNWCDLNWNHKGNWNAHKIQLLVFLIALFSWDWTIISLWLPKWWRVCISWSLLKMECHITVFSVLFCYAVSYEILILWFMFWEWATIVDR